MNSKFPEWVAEKIKKDPYIFWKVAKYDALRKVADFFDDQGGEEKTQALLEKLDRARKEYPDPNYTRAEVQGEIEEEIIDLVGWTLAGEYSNEKKNQNLS